MYKINCDNSYEISTHKYENQTTKSKKIFLPFSKEKENKNSFYSNLNSTNDYHKNSFYPNIKNISKFNIKTSIYNKNYTKCCNECESYNLIKQYQN